MGPSQPQLEIATHEMKEQEYLNLLLSLNPEQILFFYDVLNSIKTQDMPIYRFLSGGAGVGKSHLITAIYQACLKYYNSRSGEQFDENNIILLAPTGKAAYNIKGNTIHSAMKIPASQSLAYKPLTTDKLNTFRLQFGHLNLVIIDEVSMVGACMLNFIHKRLQELMGNSQHFGGVNIICVGDLYQLRPVFDDFIFKQPRQNHHDSYGILATNLWQTHFQMYQLRTIMRQRDSLDFAEMLNRLREGQHTEQDITLLKTRIISPSAHSSIPSKAPRLFLENAKVNQYNEEVYNAAQTQSIIVAAQDNVVEPASQEVRKQILHNIPTDPSKTMQLQTKLHLAIGERYDISVNVNVADGLANGASGVLQKASLTKAHNTSSGILWVLFDNPQVGQQARQSHNRIYRQQGVQPDWTPIVPTTRAFTVSRRITVKRTQFPLRPAASKTVHRSQGDTLASAVVDLSTKRKMHGIHYVALSRVQTN